jgi:IS30 family transposase
MRQRRHPLTAEQGREMWARWKKGETLSQISSVLGKARSSVHGFLLKDGGIAPRTCARNERHLNTTEREEISRGLAAGMSLRALGLQLGRAPSTISREVARNGGRQVYRAGGADERAWQQAKRVKPCLLSTNEPLRLLVAQRLQEKWAPQQISGWLKVIHHNDPTMQVSHETIYRSLFIQARGALKKELMAHLRCRRAMRKPQGATSKGDSRGQIVDAISISERPAEAEDRAIPGHWEGDLISGSRNSHIATLVERHSRFAVLVQVDGKDTATVVAALIRKVQTLPEGLMATLTWDRGKEMASHKNFTVATDVQVYFCDPRSPWQRGSNENTNGLLRQYFPKGTDLSRFDQAYLDRVANQLNMRPRKTLGYISPADTLAPWVLQ